ncbi:hypothetical protein MM440_01265 [Arsenicicoccus piscis]|uniref:hypothetical protein n=1 Tax=Arsenicicoccus piscis TaxID=673954 RepID=UPI001F4C9EB9|nr:hypothetical protein [Arsenicicoccus piscis]MCH8626448.1 hypothetical protein [Arsenicicoccus piscis]
MSTPRLAPRTTRTVTAASCLALASSVLAGCSGEPDVEASQVAASRAAAAVTSAPDGSVGGRKDLTADRCTADAKGAWSYTATLTNHQTTAQTYAITVSIVDGKTSTVYGTKALTATVQPKKSTPIKAERFYTKRIEGALCVTRVTRKAA